jgi:hypothetical protein
MSYLVEVRQMRVYLPGKGGEDSRVDIEVAMRRSTVGNDYMLYLNTLERTFDQKRTRIQLRNNSPRRTSNPQPRYGQIKDEREGLGSYLDSL